MYSKTIGLFEYFRELVRNNNTGLDLFSLFINSASYMIYRDVTILVLQKRIKRNEKSLKVF